MSMDMQEVRAIAEEEYKRAVARFAARIQAKTGQMTTSPATLYEWIYTVSRLTKAQVQWLRSGAPQGTDEELAKGREAIQYERDMLELLRR